MNRTLIKVLIFEVEELMYGSFHSLHIIKGFPSEEVLQMTKQFVVYRG